MSDSRSISSRSIERPLSRTQALLICGAVAGPLYLVATLAQALMRPGFDLSRHDVSLLSNGSLGWIQIANFGLSGSLTIAGAVGIHWSMLGGRGSTWGPRLIGVYGAGLIGAGLFIADPVSGFPPGTPANAAAFSLHGMLHLLCAAIGFAALIVATFVLARRFATSQQRGWSRYSVATGVIFLLSFLGITIGRPLAVAAGINLSVTVLGLWIGVVLAWLWLTAIAVKAIGSTAGGL